MSVELKAAGYRLIIRPDPVEEMSDGGIVIVQDEKIARAATQTGELIAIGDIAWEAFGPNHSGKPWAKVGDKVLYSKYAAKFFNHPETDEILGLLQDEDIIAVLIEEEDKDE